MLVLTRKSQDSIRIGGNITVTVLRIKGNTVRIGIEAPESVRIVRGELPDFNSPDFNSIVEESQATLSGQQTRGDNAETQSAGRRGSTQLSVHRIPLEKIHPRHPAGPVSGQSRVAIPPAPGAGSALAEYADHVPPPLSLGRRG